METDASRARAVVPSALVVRGWDGWRCSVARVLTLDLLGVLAFTMLSWPELAMDKNELCRRSPFERLEVPMEFSDEPSSSWMSFAVIG